MDVARQKADELDRLLSKRARAVFQELVRRNPAGSPVVFVSATDTLWARRDDRDAFRELHARGLLESWFGLHALFLTASGEALAERIRARGEPSRA